MWNQSPLKLSKLAATVLTTSSGLDKTISSSTPWVPEVASASDNDSEDASTAPKDYHHYHLEETIVLRMLSEQILEQLITFCLADFCLANSSEPFDESFFTLASF